MQSQLFVISYEMYEYKFMFKSSWNYIILIKYLYFVFKFHEIFKFLIVKKDLIDFENNQIVIKVIKFTFNESK